MPHDDTPYWTNHRELWTGEGRLFSGTPEHDTIWGRFHQREERYHHWGNTEIVPIQPSRGYRTYVHMQPYVLKPQQSIAIGLYAADPPQPLVPGQSIGIVTGPVQMDGFDEIRIGNAQAWHYPTVATWVIWECFLDNRFRRHPLVQDPAMAILWRTFEAYLLALGAPVTTIVTPSRDPIASQDDYQAFLTTLGYAPLHGRTWGKHLA